jgi:hypothetical protein
MVSEKSGAHYVGGGYDYPRRWMAHKSMLKRQIHLYQKSFYSALKNGSLSFFVLQSCSSEISKSQLHRLEQYWAEYFPNRVNKNRNVTGRGRKFSSTTREKLRQANLGKSLSESHREKVSKSLLGNKRSLGYRHTPRTIEKMRNAHKGCIPWNLGISPSESTRRKLSAAGCLRKQSAETRKKISDANLRRHMEQVYAWMGN